MQPRSVWFTRHGESEFNVLGQIGGDSPLSAARRAYARALADVVRDRIRADVVVWTSTLRRTIETARDLGLPARAWRALDEIDAGICDGMTYAEIAAAMPGEYEARSADKFRYRYPRGESYQDVIQRLEPVIFELERERAPVLVVGHQAVLRALYAYMMDRPAERVPLRSPSRSTPSSSSSPPPTAARSGASSSSRAKRAATCAARFEVRARP